MIWGVSSVIVILILYHSVVMSVLAAYDVAMSRQRERIKEIGDHSKYINGLLKHSKNELVDLHFKWRSGEDVPLLLGSVSSRKMEKEASLAPDYMARSVYDSYDGGKLNF